MYDVLNSSFDKIDTLEMVSSANYSVYWQETGGITLIAAATAHNLGPVSYTHLTLPTKA